MVLNFFKAIAEKYKAYKENKLEIKNQKKEADLLRRKKEAEEKARIEKERELQRKIQIENFNEYLHETSDPGRAGEYFTYQLIKEIFPENRIFRNVFLKNYYDDYCEIDIIAISSNGVFVFESKNYKGWIFGRESDNNWTQTFKNGEKYKLINPVKQNKSHILAINYNLKISKIKYYSIIVFSDECNLKSIDCKSEKTYVLNRYNLLEMLRWLQQNESQCLSDPEINALCEFFETKQRPPIDVIIEHAKKIYKCPMCNSNITDGTISGEVVLTCKNYPQCNYYKKIWQPYQKKGVVAFVDSNE